MAPAYTIRFTAAMKCASSRTKIPDNAKKAMTRYNRLARGFRANTMAVAPPIAMTANNTKKKSRIIRTMGQRDPTTP